MPTACINQPDCRVSLKSERLEVFGRNEQTQREEVLREIPLRDLDRLILTESVQIPDQCTLCKGRGLISEHRWNTCVTREDKEFREKARRKR